MGRRIDADDLVDATAVAALLGLKQRTTVSIHRGRYPEFPAPVVDMANGRYPLWVRQDIEQWEVARRWAHDVRPAQGARTRRASRGS